MHNQLKGKPVTSKNHDETPAEPVTEDLGDFSVEVTAKPAPGTRRVIIPPQLAELLAANVPAILTSDDKELTLTARDDTAAKRLTMYARAWGALQEPRLYIHKLPNRRDMTKNVVRLAVEIDSEERVKRGRKAASGK